MYKLVALFTHPADPDAFDEGFNIYLPLTDALPGLRKVIVSHAHGGPEGATPFYLMHELIFDDLLSVREAMASPPGLSAARQLWAFAADNVSLFFAEHQEEER